MTMSMAATHARGKKAKDNIFVMNARAQEDARQNGKENVLMVPWALLWMKKGILCS